MGDPERDEAVIAQVCRDAPRNAILDEAFEASAEDNPFAIDPMPLLRDAVAVQSQRALELAREAGVETP